MTHYRNLPNVVDIKRRSKRDVKSFERFLSRMEQRRPRRHKRSDVASKHPSQEEKEDKEASGETS